MLIRWKQTSFKVKNSICYIITHFFEPEQLWSFWHPCRQMPKPDGVGHIPGLALWANETTKSVVENKVIRNKFIFLIFYWLFTHKKILFENFIQKKMKNVINNLVPTTLITKGMIFTIYTEKKVKIH